MHYSEYLGLTRQHGAANKHVQDDSTLLTQTDAKRLETNYVFASFERFAFCELAQNTYQPT